MWKYYNPPYIMMQNISHNTQLHNCIYTSFRKRFDADKDNKNYVLYWCKIDKEDNKWTFTL